MKTFKRILLFLALLIVVAVAWGTNYLFNFALETKVAPGFEQATFDEVRSMPHMTAWIDSLQQASALHDTVLIATDGTPLHGYFVHASQPTPNTAILIHGYTDNAIRMLKIGHIYSHTMDYNIILPNLRAHGKSGGQYIQMGWHDRRDLFHWLHLADALYGDSTQIAVHGISMGGATAMMLSGEEDLPPNVKVFVADCGYTSVWDEFSVQIDDMLGLPTFPLLYTADFYCQAREGWGFKEASALAQVKKSKAPIFFIHGNQDQFVPTRMAYELHDAKQQGDKDLWITTNPGHALSFDHHIDQYTRRTADFVSKYISGKREE